MKTLKDIEKEIVAEFVEAGADLEHKRWASWQKYLHGLCAKNADGSLTIPAWQVEKAERQIATAYAELSEHEKEADRREVRSYLPLLTAALSFVAEETKKAVMPEKFDELDIPYSAAYNTVIVEMEQNFKTFTE